MVNALRQKKLDQIAEFNAQMKFGKVIQIFKQTYSTEVQQKCHTVIHISSDHLTDCKKMNHALNLLAEKFPTVKFCKIDFQQAADGFPEELCPTLIIYSAGQMIEKLTLMELGGRQFTVDQLEWRLSSIGIVVTDLENDPAPRQNIDEWVRDQM